MNLSVKEVNKGARFKNELGTFLLLSQSLLLKIDT
jgi:hypothetical protein